jgi:hypothetical protein
MFCPKCATQNVEGVSFCRSCGANIGLVPQALTGQLPSAPAKHGYDWDSRRKRRREPSLDNGIRHFMMGLAFIIISVLVGKYSPGGWTWWYWLLIPGFTLLRRGVSDMLRFQQANVTAASLEKPKRSAGTRPPGLPVQRTGELMAPVPSVTEGTTMHLGAEAPTRHFDPLSGEEKLP